MNQILIQRRNYRPVRYILSVYQFMKQKLICMEKHLKVKHIKQGVKLPCIVTAGDFDFNYDDFGPDNRQMYHLHFNEHILLK